MISEHGVPYRHFIVCVAQGMPRHRLAVSSFGARFEARILEPHGRIARHEAAQKVSGALATVSADVTALRRLV